jgi:hypothetical protein
MTDKELVQQRIDELKEHIASGRQTGKTYRAINNIIEELFSKPVGSKIHLIDNPEKKDTESIKSFANEFSKRMVRDFPDTFFKISYPEPGVAVVTRVTETYQEIAAKRLKQWEKKLEEME